MHAFFKCCVTLAHVNGTPAKLTVWILSPPLAAAFGQIVPMPSTIAHTSHNCGTPCNHIILCTDMLRNTLQASPINPCLANISLRLLCTYTSDSQPPSVICKRNTCVHKTIHIKHDNKTEVETPVERFCLEASNCWNFRSLCCSKFCPNKQMGWIQHCCSDMS